MSTLHRVMTLQALDGYVTRNNNPIDIGKGKGFPYMLPSVGPGADLGVQAVSPQVTISDLFLPKTMTEAIKSVWQAFKNYVTA